jgi:hypothetical protein
MTGSRIAKNCGSSGKYFYSIDECIPLSIASNKAFLDTFLIEHNCNGSVIDTVEKLEGLRYCKKITSGLTISVYDDNADFSSVFDIETIQGVPLNDRSLVDCDAAQERL